MTDLMKLIRQLEDLAKGKVTPDQVISEDLAYLATSEEIKSSFTLDELAQIKRLVDSAKDSLK